MTLESKDYALLAQASYNDPVLDKRIVVGGLEYKAIDFANDPKTGFQATAYDHLNANGSHEVVIAYRGTEFGREPVHDGLTDAGMALAGINAQTAQSEAFTQKVLAKAEQKAEQGHYGLNVTVTGHSLGGTLAEINAYKFGLHGETFNAYGAAGLLQGVPEGGHQVIDHVRATDVVSAGSRHFGEVRVYANQQDIDTLAKAGYSNSPFLNELPTHAPILGSIQGDAHGIGNFAPDPKTHATILSPEDAQRAQANAVMIDAYRSDIRHARTVVGIPGEAVTLQAETAIGVGVLASEKAVQGTRAVEHGAQYVGHKDVQGADYLADRTMQGVHAVEHGAQRVAHGASQEYTELSTRLDRMLEAAKVGDWASFSKDNKVFADMVPGRELRANAVANVDRQEQHTAQLHAVQQQAQAQQQAQQMTQGPVMQR
jgi:hypothetical protein